MSKLRLLPSLRQEKHSALQPAYSALLGSAKLGAVGWVKFTMAREFAGNWDFPIAAEYKWRQSMRKQKIAQITLLALAVYITAGFACNSYLKAAELSHDFALGVQAFQSSEIVFHNAGKIDDTEHITLQNWILRVAEAGKAMDTAIVAGHSATTAQAKVNAAIDATTGLLNDGVLMVKNPESKAALQLSLVTLKSILGSILALGAH